MSVSQIRGLPAPQVLDSKTSYPARSFSHEERFEPYNRDANARITPGPGTYRT